MNTAQAKMMHEGIRAAERILLLTDERIDGDTIGSTLGFYHILKAMGKEVDVFSPKDLPGTFAFLPGSAAIHREEAIFDGAEYDLLMSFDNADGVYLEPLRKRMKSPSRLFVFDHHKTNPGYGDLNLIEDDAASTADLVWRFAKTFKLPVNKEAAECILTGICTDTDAFYTSNTTAACMQAAHELTQLGARLQVIVRETMMNKSVAALKLWGLAFERLHENIEFEALATAIRAEDMHKLGATKDDLEGLSNFLNAMVEGADKILVLYEQKDGSVKGGLRAQTSDVSSIARRYGGGGHKLASGFTVNNAHLEEKDGQWFVVETR
ncbi:MAG: DHH family phosphoesterase [bacterium]|nr:DHH family phosphoesterase [bacterium]